MKHGIGARRTWSCSRPTASSTLRCVGSEIPITYSASHSIHCQSVAQTSNLGQFDRAETTLKQAWSGLRAAGQQDDVPRGLLACAELAIARADAEGAHLSRRITSPDDAHGPASLRSRHAPRLHALALARASRAAVKGDPPASSPSSRGNSKGLKQVADRASSPKPPSRTARRVASAARKSAPTASASCTLQRTTRSRSLTRVRTRGRRPSPFFLAPR